MQLHQEEVNEGLKASSRRVKVLKMVQIGELGSRILLTTSSNEIVFANSVVTPLDIVSFMYSANSGSVPMRFVAAACFITSASC